MSEVVEQKEAPAVVIPPLALNGTTVTVERNGIAKEYKLWKFLKGDSRGAEYPCPDVTEETKFDETITWFSKKLALNVLQNFAKAVHQKLRRDCVNTETGEFDLAKFVRKAANFDVAGLTLKLISDKIDELQAENGARIMKATPADFANPEWQAETRRLTEEIQNYMAEWDEKKGSKTKDEDVQPSVVA